jgi:hypothetical protein
VDAFAANSTSLIAMSLAQHVSSNEGVDRELLEPSIGPECVHVVRRVLSYDVFPPSQVEDEADHIPAYKVSAARRAGERTVVGR